MGKRKSSAKAPPKKARAKLDITFNCPFCNADKSVHCDMDRSNDIGTAKCNVCGEKYATNIHALSEPIDVYAEWLDECEKVQEEGAQQQVDDEDS